MYRVNAEKTSVMPGVLLAVIGAVVWAIWTWSGPVWLLSGALVIPALIFLLYYKNQYIMLDPDNGVMSVPLMLFFREKKPCVDVHCDVDTELLASGEVRYLLVMSGEFGETRVELSGFEAYMQEAVKKYSRILGLA